MTIPLRSVCLPSAATLQPYLSRIDSNKWYSNRGPLLIELEARLARTLGVNANEVSVVSNATSGLSVALLASSAKAGKTCIMPALTFAACPAAARAAGLNPVFADIDSATLMITPQSIQPAIKKLGGLSGVGAVMPVSLYGAAVDTDLWEAFNQETGIPVVVDAAWCFDNLNPSRLPAVVSLHATKVLGLGEGGLIVSTDSDFIDRTKKITNFGLNEQRVSEHYGLNAKMSEYGAAVGHAALDQWPETRDRTIRVARDYHELLSQVSEADIVNEVDGTWAPGTILIRLRVKGATSVTKQLAGHSIEARHWWGSLCSDHPAYEDCLSADLPVSIGVIGSLINLPFSTNLYKPRIKEIVTQLSDAASLR